MTFDALLASWDWTPSAIIIKGKGCHWNLVDEWRSRYCDNPPIVFCLNNDNDPREATPDLHFDMHMPRRHHGMADVPTMVHHESIELHATVRFPIERFDRRKFGCTTAYMQGIAWLLLDRWPKALVLMPGCNYNSTPGEREKERESINYWAGRIEKRMDRAIRFEGQSRAVDRHSAAYECGRVEEVNGPITSIQNEDYR